MSDTSPSRRGTNNRQQAIYTQGMAGRVPRIPPEPRALAAAAAKAMTRAGRGYIDGGAGTEATIGANRAAFDGWQIMPRMLADVSHRDTAITLFGRRLAQPFLLSPIGVLDLAHTAADIGVAEAAASRGVPMIFSNQASQPMEACAAAMDAVARDAPRWFQLYWPKSDALAESLVARAEACGCEALVVTLDTTLLGWRPRDLTLGHLPFLHGRGIAQYTSDPVFQDLMATAPTGERPPITWATLKNALAAARRYPGPTWNAMTSGKAIAAVRQFIATYSRPDLSWDDLAWLRERTRLPILLKGVLAPDDARRAEAAGMDGLIVSNHGGRQVDGAIASLDALPAIAAAVPDMPLILDSGVRTGADIFKALALGATAVGIGRPYAWALALGGRAGVAEWIDNTAAEFELTMALAGCRDIADITDGTARLTRRGPVPASTADPYA